MAAETLAAKEKSHRDHGPRRNQSRVHLFRQSYFAAASPLPTDERNTALIAIKMRSAKPMAPLAKTVKEAHQSNGGRNCFAHDPEYIDDAARNALATPPRSLTSSGKTSLRVF